MSNEKSKKEDLDKRKKDPKKKREIEPQNKADKEKRREIIDRATDSKKPTKAGY